MKHLCILLFKPNQINEIESMLSIMDKTPERLDNWRDEFKEYTKQLDKARNECFEDVFPKLKEMMR